MSPQTETKASVGFKAGVKEYKLTYYTPEYETNPDKKKAAELATSLLSFSQISYPFDFFCVAISSSY
jgi:hypothetical protein